MEQPILQNLENQIRTLSTFVQEGLALLSQQIGGLHLQISELTGRVARVEAVVEELKEEILAVGEAVSKDAETIIRHDVRIGRLEKAIYTT